MKKENHLSATASQVRIFFCISELFVFIFVSFLTGRIKLSCRQHAAQRPEVPHSVF